MGNAIIYVLYWHPRPRNIDIYYFEDVSLSLEWASFIIVFGVKGWSILLGVVPVLGFADLITKDGVVIDNKVRKQNRVNDLTKDIQLVTYADVGNFSKVGIALVTDNKNPKAEIYTAQISDSSKSLVRERIKSVRNGIKKKVFLPAPEGSWYCSEKWCSFWNICPYGDG